MADRLSRPRLIAFSALSLLIGLLALEGLARAILPRIPEPAPPPDLPAADEEWLINAKLAFKHGFFLPDDHVFWRPRPGYRQDPRGVPVYGTEPMILNQHGHRSPPMETAKPAGKKRVMILGGSHPFGMWVNTSQVYSAVLQDLLDERQPGAWQVMNAASPGHTTYQGLQYLQHHGLELQPDIVVFDLGMNDGLRLSVDFAVPDHELGAVPEWAGAATETASGLALYRLLIKVVAATRPPKENPGVRVPPPQRENNLRAVGSIAAEHGFRVLYMGQVGVESWKGPGKANCTYRAEGFDPVLDVCELFEALGPAAGNYFVDPIHANAQGHSIIGQAVYGKLDALGWLD
jgi:lysophospholipase L1-like esterase